MPICVIMWWWTANGRPGGVPGAGGALPCIMPSAAVSMNGASSSMATMRFSLGYCAAAYARRRAFAVPGLTQEGEVAERVELRALLSVLVAFVEGLGVESVLRKRQHRSGLGLDRVGAGERRFRHRVRAHLRELIGLRLGVGEV